MWGAVNVPGQIGHEFLIRMVGVDEDVMNDHQRHRDQQPIPGDRGGKVTADGEFMVSLEQDEYSWRQLINSIGQQQPVVGEQLCVRGGD